MRLAALALALLVLAACKARLQESCEADEDCWSGRCSRHRLAGPCEGLRVCTLTCEEHEDCMRLGRLYSDTGWYHTWCDDGECVPADYASDTLCM